MPFVLKLKCQEEVRRAQLADEELSYDAVRGMIRAVWPELGDVVATYADEDGDRCSLCAATFPDFRTHGEEKKGHTLFRLELSVAQGARAEPPAASVEAPSSGEQPAAEQAEAQVNDIAATEAGDEVVASDVAWKGKGKGKEKGKGKGWCRGGEARDSEAWLLRPKKLLRVLSRLRATEGVSGKSAASLVAHILPGLAARLREDGDFVEVVLRSGSLPAKALMEELSASALSTPALQATASRLLRALSEESTPVAPAVADLLASICELPLEAKVSLLERLFSGSSAQSLLDAAQIFAPCMARARTPLEHDGVECHGCGSRPMKGIRFKCKSCADYDLCGECYAEHGAKHGGGHEFQCLADDSCQRWRPSSSSEGDAWKGGRCASGWQGEGWKGRGCRGEGAWKGKGKGKGKDGGCADEAWLVMPRKLLWVLAGLRSMDGSDSATSLLAHLLPHAAAQLAEQQDAAELALRSPEMRAVLRDVCALAMAKPLLEGEAAMAIAASVGETASLVQALVPLLLAAAALPFESQVELMAELLAQPSVQVLVDSASAWTAQWGPAPPLEHGGVACDGCGACPLRGIRFKCASCPNYDLCGECYGKMRESHGHEFTCKAVDWGHMWRKKQQAWWSAIPPEVASGLQRGWEAFAASMKGLCKGKAKGFQAQWQGSSGCGFQAQWHGPNRACAGSCGRAATWHPTHCCGKCQRHGGRHGHKCEGVQMPIPSSVPQPEEQNMQSQQQKQQQSAQAQASEAQQKQQQTTESKQQQQQQHIEAEQQQQTKCQVQSPDSSRACAGGCGSAATWHPTHCCRKCQRHGGQHGPACEGVQMPVSSLASQPEEQQTQTQRQQQAMP